MERKADKDEAKQSEEEEAKRLADEAEELERAKVAAKYEKEAAEEA